jgi:hypothetical protein
VRRDRPDLQRVEHVPTAVVGVLGDRRIRPGAGEHRVFADDAVVRDSQVGLTEIPGIGFEGKAAFHRVLRELHNH